MIYAIVYRGKMVRFTKKEVKEMIKEISEMSNDEFDNTYAQSDNLPKWLWASGKCKRSRISVLHQLKKLNLPNRTTIDVRY